MRETYVECMDHEVLVYVPGTTEVAIATPSLEEALAFARAEWPDLGVRVILPKDARISPVQYADREVGFDGPVDGGV